MQQTAEVIVIGAGVIGLSTAYHLARMGLRDVLVLEKEQIGAGSSSRSAAMLSVQFCQDELTVRMARYAYERYMQFEEELGTPIDFHRTGWLYLATEASAEALRQQVALLQGLDVESELLAPAEIKYRYPALNTEDLVLGSWGPDDGPFDPHMIMSGYARQLRRLGGRLQEGVEVQDLLLDGGRVRGVVTNRGPIGSELVVNAAGPWAAEVGRWAGVDIPLRNSARSIIVTNPIEAIPADWPFVEDLEVEWYFRPEVDGVLMGMGARPVDKPSVGLDEEQIEAIVEHAVYRVPVLEQASLLTAWTGIRPLSADGRPILGPSDVEGFFLNCGWGGVGFILAPLAGQLAAEMIVEGAPTTMEGTPLSPARFNSAGVG